MKKVLIITDEKKSSHNQCDSLLYYLKKKVKLKTEYLTIKRRFIHNLPNVAIYIYLVLSSFFKKNNNQSADIIISCGRITAAYSLICKKYNKNCKIIHVLDPYCLRNRFDKILIPSHDLSKFSNNRNVLEFLGTFVSKRKLVNQDLKNYQELESRKNIISCLIGGDGKSSKLKVSEINDLVDKINQISERYTVVYCFSRRTSEITKRIIKKRKKLQHYCYNYKDKDPYWYLINKSSHFIVTEDSVSMTSDAAFTGKPVYMVKIKNKKNKIKNFVQNLEEKGVVRYFDGKIVSWKYKKINESERIANVIKKII
tara:strand:+ start:6 stop:941 length:936 start_codon:yes stop_codon:yes gene_type:complete